MSQIVSRSPVTNGKDDRSDAWVISCDSWDESNPPRPGLILPLNPESLEIRLPLRGAESSMYGGKFIARRRDPRTSSAFDYPSIALRFNSGNIVPLYDASKVIYAMQESNPRESQLHRSRGAYANRPDSPDPKPNTAGNTNNLYGLYVNAESKAAGPNRTPGIYAGLPEIPVGVQNLYALFSLINEGWIKDAGRKDTGVETGVGAKKYTQLNRIRVSTSNLVMPGLVLYGFFDESGIRWAEAADNPTNFEVGLNMIITHSQPRLRGVELATLISSYKSLFTQRTTYNAEYEIGYKYQSGTCMDPIPAAPPTVQQAPKPWAERVSEPAALTWADRINNASTAWFGANGSGGAVRTAIGSGVGVSTSAADRYATRALKAVDPVYATQVAARKAQAADSTAKASA